MVVSTGAGADTVMLAVPLTVPLVPFLAVMVAVPVASAVNTPVVGLIVPTVVLLLLQATAGLIAMDAPFWSKPAAVKVCVPPTTFDADVGETVMVFRTGAACTVIVISLKLVIGPPDNMDA